MKLLNFCLAFLFLLSLASCSEDENLDDAILIQNEETFVRAIETDDYITIRVESLADTTNNANGNITGTDYCNISFDINSNKEIDSEIDFGYESPTENYDICSYYFLEAESITHCAGHPTTATFTESFSTSAESQTPHMIWELIIPKEELDQTRKLSFTVKTIDNGFFRTYPTNIANTNPVLFYFNKTLTFNW